MDWMTDKQKEQFDSVCLLIDSITNPGEFFDVMNKINNTYDVDVVTCAREFKHCYNSAQYT